jgi:putative addiction module killer protein
VIYKIETTSEFNAWFMDQDDKIKGAIRARFSRIQEAGHFGIVKSVGDGVFEFKWKNGLRVYFGYLEKTRILVLLGGNKNGQSKDIKKAKKILI